MKKDETFLLVDLKDEKSKSIAQTITNDTCRTILSYLAQKTEATESVIAKKIELPISTVHYNLQQLKKAGLIRAKEFVWSDKGKKMPVYQLAKKFIIIAPDTTHGIKTKLKSILPAALVGLVGTVFVYGFTRNKTPEVVSVPFAKEYLNYAADDVADRAVAEAASVVTAPSTMANIASWLSNVVQEPAFYFLLGVVVTIVVLVIVGKKQH